MRYQAKPKHDAEKLFIDLMNHYRFRVDMDIDYGFTQKLRDSSGIYWGRFDRARQIIHHNISFGAVLGGWSLQIENPIFDTVIVPSTIPDLVEMGEQLATMVMVAGIPYRTELPHGLHESDDAGLFIAYKRKSIYKENIGERIVLMPLQWVMSFTLAALGVADEDAVNKAIHAARISKLCR